jgi:diacylglycerol kinase family enzyme
MLLYPADEMAGMDEIVENDIWVFPNPKAGSKARHYEKDMRSRLGTDHINYYTSTSREDLRRMISWLAAKAEKNQTYIMAIVVGGDGTFHDTVNSDGDLGRIIFGYTDGGTSGDYLRTLNIKKHSRMCNLIDALRDNRVPLEERVKLVDMIRISYSLGDEEKSVKGLNLFSTGFDGEVCKKVNESATDGGVKKKMGFIPASLKVLKKYVPLEIEYIINGETKKKDVAKKVLSFIFINGQCAGSDMKYNPHGEIDDGLAECLIAQYSSKNKVKMDIIRLAFHVKYLRDNKIVDSPPLVDRYNRYGVRYVDKIQSMDLRIMNPEAAKEAYFESDGEHYQYEPTKPLHLEIMPKAIHVLHVPDN